MRVRPVTAAPLFPDDGPVGARIWRRVRGISIEIVLFAVVTVLLPVLLVVAAAVDLTLWLRTRKPWVGVRLAAFGWWFLLTEMRALLTIATIWVITGGPFGRSSLRRRRYLYGLRIHWARSHLGGIRVLFALRLEVEGLDDAGPGPILMMMRHASIIDNMLPDAIVARRHGYGLRFVIKRELQVLPTIDIGGRWVPTNFVRRGSGDSAGEIDRLRALADDLGPGEALMIYPEGTRFTPKKLARALEVIAERQPEISAQANRLRNILPPRLGGPLALMNETEDVDVVFCGHVGFDGFQYVSHIWAGGLVGTTIRVKLWRHAASSIPSDPVARRDWLYEQWQILDDWIGEQIPDRAEYGAEHRVGGSHGNSNTDAGDAGPTRTGAADT